MAFNTTYVGTQIGNYRVTSQLASGGFGSVYLAQHVILSGRIAAFKVLHAVYLNAPHERESFFQEAQLLEKLKHAYILPILDVGLYQNMVPYIIAEYAQHGSLRERIQRRNGKPLPIGEVLTILSQVGEALQHAHQQNIIHRDLKPENILFNTQDVALLADFGIATALTTASVKVGQVAGTPLYMAPEQFRGMASKESDQYGLACIAYELLTGSTPFVSADFMAMAYQHVHEQPRPPRQFNPALPIHMEQAIMKALSKERHDRYPSVTAFIAALQSPSVQQIPPPPPPYPLRQVGGTPIHTPPIKDARQTPPLQNKGQINAYPPGIARQALGTKPTGEDRIRAALCYLIFSMAYFLGIILGHTLISVLLFWIIFALICYFAGRKRPFVRFHFMQSQIFFVFYVIIFIIGAAISNSLGLFAVNVILPTIALGNVGLSLLSAIALSNVVLSLLPVGLSLLSAIALSYLGISLLYIILAVAGKRTHIPIIGQLADKYADRQPKGARKIS